MDKIYTLTHTLVLFVLSYNEIWVYLGSVHKGKTLDRQSEQHLEPHYNTALCCETLDADFDALMRM